MTDYTELKRLAEAALRNWPDSKLLERPEYERFIDAARPDVVLALITENDRLNTECKQLILLEHNGGTVEAATNLLAERDQLKAEQASLNAQVDTLTEWYLNALKDAEAICKDCDQLRTEVAGLRTGYEAYERVNAELKAEVERLDKLLIDASGTLRKASSWICREVEAGTKSATHWAIRLRETADQIDTALGQGGQS